MSVLHFEETDQIKINFVVIQIGGSEDMFCHGYLLVPWYGLAIVKTINLFLCSFGHLHRLTCSSACMKQSSLVKWHNLEFDDICTDRQKCENRNSPFGFLLSIYDQGSSGEWYAL